MLFPHRTRELSREDGFTMIELLVVVIIVAILAAIAVPVYLNIKAAANRSALRSDVNATVKKVSIALTNGATVDEVTANYGAAYVPTNLGDGEVISVVPASGGTTATTASFAQDRDLSNDGYVIRSAVYRGTTNDGVARAKTVTNADGQEFYVYGVLVKSKGAAVDYSYSYTSIGEKYSQGSGDGTGTKAEAPTLAAATLPQATLGQGYTANLTVTGTPAPSLSITAGGLPTGIALSNNGALQGSPNDAPGTYNFTVTATNPVGNVVRSYSIQLASPSKVKINTSSLATAYTNGTYTGAAIDVTNTATTGTNVFNITGLPSGYTYSTSTGAISGTSTVTSSSQLTVKVTNGLATDQVGLTFTVAAGTAPAISNPGAGTTWSGTLGTAFSKVITVTGSPAPTVTFSNNLPAGLSYNAATGKLEGTPTEVTDGAVTITITAKNAVNPTGVSRTVSLEIAGAQVDYQGFSGYSFGDTIPRWSGGYANSTTSGNGGDGKGYDSFGGTLTYTNTGLTVGKSYTVKAVTACTNKVTVSQAGSADASAAVADTCNNYTNQPARITFVATSATVTIKFTGSRAIVDEFYLYRNN